MIYKGYKIRVRCIDWEQEEYLGKYWSTIASHTGYKDIIGLGMNWTDDNLYFDYALGTIDDQQTLEKIEKIDFSKTEFEPVYFEIELPDFSKWISYKGKEKDLKEIYDKEIGYNKKFDFELEYIDGKGNLEIKIHFIN